MSPKTQGSCPMKSRLPSTHASISSPTTCCTKSPRVPTSTTFWFACCRWSNRFQLQRAPQQMHRHCFSWWWWAWWRTSSKIRGAGEPTESKTIEARFSSSLRIAKMMAYLNATLLTTRIPNSTSLTSRSFQKFLGTRLRLASWLKWRKMSSSPQTWCFCLQVRPKICASSRLRI